MLNLVLPLGSHTNSCDRTIHPPSGLLSNFVFSLFSFGKRSAGSLRRGCECIVLEPSEMIVVSPVFWLRAQKCQKHYLSLTQCIQRLSHSPAKCIQFVLGRAPPVRSPQRNIDIQRYSSSEQRRYLFYLNYVIIIDIKIELISYSVYLSALVKQV